MPYKTLSRTCLVAAVAQDSALNQPQYVRKPYKCVHAGTVTAMMQVCTVTGAALSPDTPTLEAAGLSPAKLQPLCERRQHKYMPKGKTALTAGQSDFSMRLMSLVRRIHFRPL